MTLISKIGIGIIAICLLAEIVLFIVTPSLFTGACMVWVALVLLAALWIEGKI